MKKKLTLKAAYMGIILLTLTLTSLGSRVVVVFSQSLPPERKHCFIIDPGHGGIDGGATSCTGKLESGFNLEIGLRLRDLLQFMGYRTKMTRTEDVSIYTGGDTIAQKKLSDLKERVRICNETDGAILLSIHQNTFSDSKYFGPQVFFADNEESKALAGYLQKSLDPTGKRGTKRAEGIYLMEHITCPGALIECGFISNPQEEAKLRSAEYQKELCCRIAASSVEYVSKSSEKS
ncbi:MAG: N-acetylmuramoyl-L-alanine amidase [Oscillospiraceae bacterium]|nr:N-acetylmuramoyl-L-alanine amidase [Oscillospiraceae bacterium]